MFRGSEQDMVLPCLATTLSNKLLSTCNSDQCPQKQKIERSNSISLLNAAFEIGANNTLNALINH